MSETRGSCHDTYVESVEWQRDKAYARAYAAEARADAAEKERDEARRALAEANEARLVAGTLGEALVTAAEAERDRLESFKVAHDEITGDGWLARAHALGGRLGRNVWHVAVEKAEERDRLAAEVERLKAELAVRCTVCLEPGCEGTHLCTCGKYPHADDCGLHPLKWKRERNRLAAALREIKTEQGRVCEDFELCKHPSCASSYAAWAIAAAALKGE